MLPEYAKRNVHAAESDRIQKRIEEVPLQQEVVRCWDDWLLLRAQGSV
jgi:hypothetical protein